MKRFLRIFFNTLTAMSLLLCMATLVLWVRSYYRYDTWYWTVESPIEVPARLISLARGRAMVTEFADQRGSWPGAPDWTPVGSHESANSATGDMSLFGLAESKPAQQWCGFAWIGDMTLAIHGTIRIRFLIVPLWFPAALFGMTPALWIIRAARRRRGGKPGSTGLCSRCGYDLRASPDRCPECGAVPGPVTT